MRVAMLTTIGEQCGIGSYSGALIAGLRTLPDTEVEVVPITRGRQPTEHYVAQAELLNAPDIDVVHIQHEHGFWGGIRPNASAFWELRYLIQKPLVLTAHTTYTLAEMFNLKHERRLHVKLAKQMLLLRKSYRDSVETAPFATAITIVHTEAARQALIERGIKPGYSVVVPTGVPEPLPAPTEGTAFREKFGLAGKRLLVLFGYIEPNKGYELALSALAELPEEIALVIAGGSSSPQSAPYRAQLEAEIARRRLAGRTVITGVLSSEDVAEAMVAAEVVLVPHTYATGSYSVMLPITHGKPIVASDLACFREMEERIDCLELFRAGDKADFTAKLRALLDNPARKQQLSANARKYAVRFSWSNVAARTREVYRRAIDIYNPASPH